MVIRGPDTAAVHADTTRLTVSLPPRTEVQESDLNCSMRAEAILSARSRIALAARERVICAVVAARPRAPTEKMKIASTSSINVKPWREDGFLIRQWNHH